jgi:hypothetical protein
VQSVVHSPMSIQDPAVERPSSPAPWAPTVRLGVIASIVAVLAAVLAHALTPLPTALIVTPLAAAAFAVSWRATTIRRRTT